MKFDKTRTRRRRRTKTERVETKAPPESEEPKGKSTEAEDWLNDGLEELMKTQNHVGTDVTPQELASESWRWNVAASEEVDDNFGGHYPTR